MPAHNHTEPVVIHSEQQIKTCAACLSDLPDPTGGVRLPDRDAIVCMACSRDLRRTDLPSRHPRRIQDPFVVQPNNPPPLPPPSFHTAVAASPPHSPQSIHIPPRRSHPRHLDPLYVAPTPYESVPAPRQPKKQQHSYPVSPPPFASPSAATPPVSITTTTSTATNTNTIINNTGNVPSTAPAVSSIASVITHPAAYSGWSPDPLADITRLRIISRGHHCLYPGAEFQGTQKSGRNSYEVRVTIMDVNFPESTLCGTLRIRGLTDDWPELTTYFDAEIIGRRYGFLTEDWGASVHEDLIHWGRFPAFKQVKPETRGTRMTIEDRDRPVVFMRWKERFLVPDHRVQDINGASFAGFYYVCVDFNPPPTPASPTSPACRLAPEGGSDVPSSSPPSHHHHPPSGVKSDGRRPRARRDSSVRRRGPPVPYSPPVATMSGFYYHQNSEP